MKKTYLIPLSTETPFFLEGTILSGSTTINKYDVVKDEGEEQYSQRMNDNGSAAPWEEED